MARAPETAPNVLLSIKPHHADAILSGDKRYEYRKVAPAKGPPLRLVLYATSPTKAIVGTAWSFKVLADGPESLIDQTVSSTPHSEDELRDYFEDAKEANAISIAAYKRLDESIPLEALREGGYEPPQNFRYLGTVPNDPENVDPTKVFPH